MLTMKHIRFDGAETVDAVDRVIFYPDTPPSADAPRSPCTPGVVSGVHSSGTMDWHYGIVYVMNEAGATVAKYDLGGDKNL